MSCNNKEEILLGLLC